MHKDKVSIDEIIAEQDEEYEEKKHNKDDDKRPVLRMSNIKLIIALFIWFLVVVSDVFRDSVLTEIGKSAVIGREVTTWGIILQGIILIVGYVILVYLTENNIL